MVAKLNLLGQTFYQLTVLADGGRTPQGGMLWLCQCTCGKQSTVAGRELRNGGTKSCGCRRPVATIARCTKHGAASGLRKGYHNIRRSYRSWTTMRRRCHDPKGISWMNYGGRGIKVCDRWDKNYEAFLEDMGEPPEGHTLDRIDVNGDYEPTNCRWADGSTQARNSNQVPFVILDGKPVRLPDGCEAIGVLLRAFHAAHLRSGLSHDEVFQQYVRGERKIRRQAA